MLRAHELGVLDLIHFAHANWAFFLIGRYMSYMKITTLAIVVNVQVAQVGVRVRTPDKRHPLARFALSQIHCFVGKGA